MKLKTISAIHSLPEILTETAVPIRLWVLQEKRSGQVIWIPKLDEHFTLQTHKRPLVILDKLCRCLRVRLQVQLLILMVQGSTLASLVRQRSSSMRNSVIDSIGPFLTDLILA